MFFKLKLIPHLSLLLTVFFIVGMQNHSFSASCVTTADNTWDCGTPNPSDDLTVNHIVSIGSNFDPTGNIIINNGGYLTINGTSIIKNCNIIIEPGGTLLIQGNAEFSSNSSVTCKGDMMFNNLLTIIETSANFIIQGGTVSSDGNILVTNGANLEVGVGSTLFTHNSIEFNSNSITVNGTVSMEGDFTNEKNITGVGSIEYVGSCSGSGTINNVSSSTYCGLSPIPLPTLGSVIVWDGGQGDGLWSSANNWNPNGVPASDDVVFIDCSCTVTLNSDLNVDGLLTIASGSTLDLNGNILNIGGANDVNAKSAKLDNFGAIVNVADLKVKGDKLENNPDPKGTKSGEGPFITNSGTITTLKMSVGNNNGGGKLTNTASGLITITDVAGTPLHVDGTICNEGTIHVEGQVLFHGAIISCGGNLSASSIKLEDNPQNGGGATGAGSDIQAQYFTHTDGCTGGESDNILLYIVPGGTVTAGPLGGPNGDDTYSFQQLLAEFGAEDTNPSPQFKINTATVGSCGSLSEVDTTPPTFDTFPNDTVVYLLVGRCSLAINWNAPVVTDNVGVEEVTSSHSPGVILPPGSIIVSYHAEDLVGNYADKSFSIEVLDTISPVISNLPNDITQNTDAGACGAIVSWTAPTTTDNCSATLSSSHNSGDFFAVGITSVSYTATDIYGNSTVLTFDVTISDNIPPAIANLPNDITQNTDAGTCGAIVNWTLPSATDNCSATLSSSHKPGDFFEPGTTTVSYTASDGQGNTVKAEFEISIVDRSAPEFTSCPSNYNILSVDTENNKTSISWELPVAIDPCSTVTLTSNFNPGDAFDLGRTEVIYTARDESGNEATCSFMVEGYQNLAPLSDNQNIYIKAGESVDICLNASDPNDEQIVIKEIKHENNLAYISDIDAARLCFLYSSDIDFYGQDTVNVILIDDGLPPLTTTATIIIDVERDTNIEINDVVTINGDQINDSWFIKNIDQYPGNSVRVFDRWGGLIFQSTGYNNNNVVWNGESNANLMSSDKYVPTGTYFYAINLGNGSKSITGAIEVIR